MPDCDLGNFGAQGSPASPAGGDYCGEISNRNFGQSNPTATTYAPGVLEGYGKRDHNWDFTTEVQHELIQGLAVTAGWYHNTGGYYRYAFGQPFSSKERVTDNILVGPGDYDEFCVTAPSDPKLPGGGGYPVCGLYNVKQIKFGQNQSIVKAAEEFGEFTSTNDFFNVTIDARLPRNIRLGGGFDTGRTVRDRCFVVDSPQELLNCRVVTPFDGADAVQAARRLPVAGRLRHELCLSEPVGSGPDGQLHRSGVGRSTGSDRIVRWRAVRRRSRTSRSWRPARCSATASRGSTSG